MAEELDQKIWVGHTGYALVEGEGNVFDIALERIEQAYSKVEEVVVSFSGGKDSTAVLMLTLEVARKLNRLPVTVLMFDEEVIDPDTIAYCETVRSWDDIDFKWLCVPIRHTLRSQSRAHWTTWDPELVDIWARAMPEGSIPHYEGRDLTYDSFSEHVSAFTQTLFPGKVVGELTGIRVQESINRRRAIITAGNFMHKRGNQYWNIKPIFDWGWQDIWKAIIELEWPHSTYYDKLWMKGYSPQLQRVAPWGNVAASREARFYPEFYPDFWEQAIIRLPELKAQARYGNSKLFKASAKPTHMTWQEYTMKLIDNFDEEDVRDFWMLEIVCQLRRWNRKSTVPFPETDIGLGRSWKQLANMIQKNDIIRTTGGGIITRDRL